MIARLYLLNTALLVTHEIDSAYWHEWTLFHLPGGIQFFLVLNFALLLVVLYGFDQIVRRHKSAILFSCVLAGAGIFTFSVHTTFILAGHPEFRASVSIALLVATLLVSIIQIVVVTLTRFQANIDDYPYLYSRAPALAGLLVAMILATGFIDASDPAAFQKYFGGTNPFLAITMTTVTGIAALFFLQSRGWFSIIGKGDRSTGVALAAVLATLFGIAVVLVDIFAGYPQDINLPLPDALLFYPVMGVVAECVFHVIPLALLLFALNALFKTRDTNSFIWPCILLVSLLEPILQLSFEPKPLAVSSIYTGLNVFAFNFVQLAIFRRFGFAATLILRLTYYLYWHIIWGYLRLELLF